MNTTDFNIIIESIFYVLFTYLLFIVNKINNKLQVLYSECLHTIITTITTITTIITK